ncbi:Co-chaperone [Meredithblackwellia eburnea MCA 4105]
MRARKGATRLAFAIVGLLAATVVGAQDLPDDAHDLPISQLLTLASTALSSGKSASALNIYEHILERDPSDFATLYKRATVRLATGQLSKAKDGFRAVLAVRDFDQAHLELARIHTKLGEYDQALEEVNVFAKMVSTKDPKDQKDEDDAKALKDTINQSQKDLSTAQKALKAGASKADVCISSATSAIKSSPNHEGLRLIRAECYVLQRDYDSAVGDLLRAAAITPALPPQHLLRLTLLSSLFLPRESLEIPQEALTSVKRCLAADPDSKLCRDVFKSLKNVEKELARVRNWIDGGKWMEAAIILAPSSSGVGLISTLKTIVETYQEPKLKGLPKDSSPVLPTDPADLEKQSPLITKLVSTLCRAYVTIGQTRKAGMTCEEVLERDPEDLWGLVSKSDKLVQDEQWEEAVRVLTTAFENTGKSDRMILEKLQKAQRLLKQSTAKDYYKVLGVSRDADAKTIKKAYRKATLKAHPDKEGGSEAKMAALNEAYEVLSNPELRARFDNGEDPNDPTANQQNPFAHGGSPFQHFFQQGGGGQQFFQQGGGQFFQNGGFKVKFG